MIFITALLGSLIMGMWGWKDLHEAVKMGSIERVQFLLDSLVEINTQDKDGNTALHYAAATQRSDIIQCLLDRGADKTIANNNNFPFGVALFGKNYEAVKILLMHKPQETVYMCNISSLYLAAYYGLIDNIDDLLEAGLPVDHTLYSDPPLMKSLTPLLAAAQGGQLSAMKHLKAKGAQVVLRGGVTLLHDMFISEDTEHSQFSSVVQLLLQWGLDINAKNSTSDTSLGCLLMDAEDIDFNCNGRGKKQIKERIKTLLSYGATLEDSMEFLSDTTAPIVLARLWAQKRHYKKAQKIAGDIVLDCGKSIPPYRTIKHNCEIFYAALKEADAESEDDDDPFDKHDFFKKVRAEYKQEQEQQVEQKKVYLAQKVGLRTGREQALYRSRLNRVQSNNDVYPGEYKIAED